MWVLRRFLRCVLWLGVWTACGSSEVSGPNSMDGGGGSTGGSGGTTGGSAGATGGSTGMTGGSGGTTGGSAGTTGGSGGSTGGSGGGTGGSGGTIGGSAGRGGSGGMPGNCGGQTCSFGQRCAHDRCGAPDSEGHCETVPLDCIFPPNMWEPVCGCDGRVRRYNCRDTDLAPAANCTKFPCGGSECTIATQYCERQVSDVGGIPDSYACKPLPAGCTGSPSCACVRSEPCGTLCAGSGALGMVLTCPGG